LEIACNVGASRRHIERRARTTAGQTGISGVDIKEMPIPLCPLDEQMQIVEAVNSMLTGVRALVVSIETNRRKATTLRQSILKRAFSGRLVPQDPNDKAIGLITNDLPTQRIGKSSPNGRLRATANRPEATLWAATKK
jgi:type I restriction enzyme S subunit